MSEKKAIVIGGSLGGLFAATTIRAAGWEVDVYERSSHDFEGRGGGIVLQPDVVSLFRRVGIDVHGQMGVASRGRVIFHPDGSVLSRDFAPQIQTSWSLLFQKLKEHFGETNYHLAKELVDFTDSSREVTVSFSDGTRASGELLVGADGSGSRVRQIIDPTNQPTYAGYIAWRGLVPESQMTGASSQLLGDFAFSSNDGSHILGYLVPGENNSLEKGERFYNWVWYRVVGASELTDLLTDKDGKSRALSIPPGQLSPKWSEVVHRDAERLLPPSFRETVLKTEQPFAQAILDLTSDKMHYGRVAIVGDAAFVPRPHTAASASKAAANALGLGDALERVNEGMALKQSLELWEEPQLSLGRHLHRQGTRAGDYLMFRQKRTA